MRAQPIRWVKLTLPPRVRDMWLLMTIRLSIISFAGIVRTLVAVGIVSDSSMLAASVFGRPRRTVTLSCSVGSSAADGAAGGACAGIGCGEAGRAVVRATGWAVTTGTCAVTGWAPVAAGGAAGGGACSATGSAGAAAVPAPDAAASVSTGWYASRTGHHA